MDFNPLSLNSEEIIIAVDSRIKVQTGEDERKVEKKEMDKDPLRS